MFYRLCLWWRARFGSTPKIRGDAVLEREITKGLFIQTRVTDYMKAHGMVLTDLLLGITHSSTREFVRRQYLSELAKFMRVLINAKHHPLKKRALSPEEEYSFDRAAVEYVSLGGRLTDALDGGYLPDELYNTASAKVADEILRPKLTREKSDADFLKRARQRNMIKEKA